MFHLRLRVTTGILLGLAIGIAALLTALSLPATGLRFAATEDALIATVDDASRVVAAFEWDETTLPARPEFAIEEPDVIPNWATYDALMADLGDLARASEASTVRVQFADGTAQTLTMHDRGFSELPGTFWLQWACALVAMVLSVLVWSPRPKELPAALFALTGTGYMISALAASVYSSRELMIDGALFRALDVVNEWGAILFASALTNLLWCYPLRLAPRGLLPGTWIAGAIAMALTVFRPFETPPLNHHLWIVLIFAVGIAGSVLQWSRTRQLAQARAILRWFLLSIYAGTGVFTVLFLLPSVIGAKILLPQAYLLATFLPMYLGMALGVLRYRLFDLERWWFYIWAWALGGIAVVLVDLFLLMLLTTAQTTSLAISVAVVGWIYFPVRQWFWRRYVVRDRGELEAWLDAALPPMLSVRQEAELVPALRRTLTSVFEPLSSSVETTTGDLVEIRDNGQALVVPLLGTRRGVRLTHAYGGARLFTRIDVATAQRVLALYAVVVRALRAQEEGAHTERERIRKDIHDDLGAKLLTLLHRADDNERALVREAIRDLRELLGALETSPVPLAAALDQWRKEYEDRCRDAHVRLLWREHGHAGDVELSARAYHHVTRILREALSNALRHAQPIQVGVLASPGAHALEILVENDGHVPDADSEIRGRGTSIMRQRAESLGGSVSWSRNGDFWQVHIALPLTTPSSHAASSSIDTPTLAPSLAPG